MILDPEITAKASVNEARYGLPLGLLRGLIQVESGGKRDAYRDDTGASGLTQIIPRYHPSVKNPFDVDEALDYTARTLASYKAEFGSWEAATAAWLAGETAVRKNIARGGNGIPDTKDKYTGLSVADYVNNVFAAGNTTGGNVGAYAGASLPSQLSVEPRNFNRNNLALFGLALMLLGAIVLAAKG